MWFATVPDLVFCFVPFCSKRTMWKNLCEKCCVGDVIYSDKCRKTAARETVDAEINNVIYMELYSGAKMPDSKY
jgi:hypothetical protein